MKVSSEQIVSAAAATAALSASTSLPDNDKSLVQQSNVAYAVAPSTTVVTTDGMGRTTTQALWWVPESKKEAEETLSRASSSQTKKLDSSITSKASTVSSHSSRNWDDALTTVTATNSLGQEYTSKIWWLPSTTVQDGETYSTDVTSIYVTSSEGHLQTVTTLVPTTLVNKAVSKSSISGKNSTASIHHNSTNAGGKLDFGYRVGGAAALVALLL